MKFCDHCGNPVYQNLLHVCPNGVKIRLTGWPKPSLPPRQRKDEEMIEKSAQFNWRNYYGHESSDDDRCLKIGRNVEMSDVGTATMAQTTVTWPSGKVWVEVQAQEPLSLFVISLEDDTELLVSAHSFDEAWRIARARTAKQAMRQMGARAVEMPILPENITWIPLPTQPQLLHVFKGKAEK